MEDILSEVFTECWGSLLYGSLIADHAFRNGTLGTTGEGGVNLRTVVLRSVDPDNKAITFYTDSRSPKMNDLKMNNRVSWLFYDHQERVQLRVSGIARIHYLDNEAQSHWSKLKQGGKKSYLAIPAPSIGVSIAANGLEYLNDNSDYDRGYQNFAVVITQVDFLEWLSLKRDGHRRAQFKLMNDSWKGQWLIP